MRPGILYAISSALGIGTSAFVVAAAWIAAAPESADMDMTFASPAENVLSQKVETAGLPAVPAPAFALVGNEPSGGPFVAGPAVPDIRATDEIGRSMAASVRAHSARAETAPASMHLPMRLALVSPPEEAAPQIAPPQARPPAPAVSRKQRDVRKERRPRPAASRSRQTVRVWYGMPPYVYPAPRSSRPRIIMVEPRWR